MYKSVSKRRKAMIRAKGILKKVLSPYMALETAHKVKFQGHPSDEEAMIKLLAAGTEVLLSHRDLDGLEELQKVISCIQCGKLPK